MAESNKLSTRDQLLQDGLALMRQVGLRGLTVHGVCERSQINKGSFVYHFGTRDQFASELMENWYAPLFERIQLEFDQSGSPLERLNAIMLQLCRYIVAHGDMIAQVLLDATAGEGAAVKFLDSVDTRHPRIIVQCIMEAQQAKQLVAGDPMHLMMFIMGSIGMPAIAHSAMRGKSVLPDIMQDAFRRHAANLDSIEQRLKWALRGIGLAALKEPS